MFEVLSTCWVFKHGSADCWKFRINVCHSRGLSLIMRRSCCWWLVMNVDRFLFEKCSTSGWWNCIKALFQSNTWICWASNSRFIIKVIYVTSWPWDLSHLLHFFHVWEPLLCWIESIRWVLFLIKWCVLFNLHLPLDSTWKLSTIFLKGKTKSRISASICLAKVALMESGVGCLVILILLVHHFWVFS